MERLFLRELSPGVVASWYRALLFPFNPFWTHLLYLLLLSLLGYLSLSVSNRKSSRLIDKPEDVDLFFMSVSAATISSMDTVEMEVFSNTQLFIFILLMFFGGEVFTSLLGLQLWRNYSRFFLKENISDVDCNDSDLKTSSLMDQIELGSVIFPLGNDDISDVIIQEKIKLAQDREDDKLKRNNSVKCLGYVVSAYLFVVQFFGWCSIHMYLRIVSNAGKLLKRKNLNEVMFSVFLTVSTFASCGFVPTNENMMVFKKNSGLLLILIPQVLMGSVLYPFCLRLIIRVLEKFTRRPEYGYMLKNSREIGYSHLLSGVQSCYLAGTALFFILVQLLLLCIMEWRSESLDGLNSYQKLVASLFQVVNTRHAGESVIDLSIISPAVLVLFVFMMYFPPYTTFRPINKQDENDEEGTKRTGTKRLNRILDHQILSQLAHLVVIIILLCITENQSMKEDPLNFSVINIVTEVISAYGNVGFSTSYSCKRQLNPQKSCQDKYIGFVGRWSNKGKLILIFVMFFGRLKKFSLKGGKVWKLS